MPFYTYIVSYKGQTYVSQARHSNFRGWIEWADIPTLNPALQRELGEKAYRGEFSEVPNRKHVWRKSLEVGGSELVVFAVQTEA